MIMEDLLLDPQLKWWMIVPISVAMVLVGLLRSQLTFLLASKPKTVPYKTARESDFLKRATVFRENHHVLSKREFETRQYYLIKSLKSEEFYAKVESLDKPENPLANMGSNDALMNMAKGNLMSFVPQTLIMAWVNFFFAGSVVMKLPFPLTDGFKSMLQSGVHTPNLNARYVSAISWYFVNLFGLRPVYSLLMNDQEAVQDIMNQQQQQQPIPNLNGPGSPKAEKMFNAEAESIQILDHESIYEGITERVLAKYGS